MTLKVDGACSRNPGPGAWVIMKDGNLLRWGFLPQCTNIEAEYAAIFHALQYAADANEHVTILTDSQFWSRIIKGIYRAKNRRVKYMHNALRMVLDPHKVTIKYVPRDEIEEADASYKRLLKNILK